MHLVDADRLAQIRHHRALRDPVIVGPLMMALIDDGCIAGRRLVVIAVGVRLQRQQPVILVEHLVLVLAALFDTRHEDLPDAVRRMQAHAVPSTVPIVEVADDAHT